MGVQIIFDNILNRKIPWPSAPSDMSYEAQDLINRLVMLCAFNVLILACYCLSYQFFLCVCVYG